MFDHKSFLSNVTTLPGVYKMFNRQGRLIYVGKAKNLRVRLASYFRGRQSASLKQQNLVANIADITITITQHENEALLLENNLIKQYSPRYNILLKDSKTYPELRLSDDRFAQLSIHRGAKDKLSRYFGPYPNVASVRETLSLIQKIFKIRQCDNVFFSHRTRPCLQYQIKRCTAPCVGKIDPDTYQSSVADAVLFLQGRSEVVTKKIMHKMELAAEALQYEKAALYRNQLASIRAVQLKQNMTSGSGDIDVLAAIQEEDQCLIEILMIRGGRMIGHRSYPLSVRKHTTLAEVLWAFLPQYYLNSPLAVSKPTLIYTNIKIKEAQWLANVLQKSWDYKVCLRCARRGQAKQWLQLALTNAQHTMSTIKQRQINWQQRFDALRDWLSLSSSPQNVFCFDVSHHHGEATTVSCVVCGPNGWLKPHYRLLHIKNIKPGDDYAAMEQGLQRLLKSSTLQPDCIVVDGGKGQLSVAHKVLKALKMTHILHIGIAKGPARQSGHERLFRFGCPSALNYESSNLGVRLLCHVRDEAHRFAIKNHRLRKKKKLIHSVVEDIPGIGRHKCKQLLHYFGGIDGVKQASIDQLMAVQGIGRRLAEVIYAALHGNLPGT